MAETSPPIRFADLRCLAAGVESRRLEPRDGAVYCGVMLFASPVTGVAGVGALRVSELLGMQRPHVSASLGRLEKAGLLVKEYNPRDRTARYRAAGWKPVVEAKEVPW